MVNLTAYENPTDAAERSGLGRLRLVSLVWAVAILAAAIVAIVQGAPAFKLGALAIAALIPAMAGAALAPMSDREWVRVALVLLWLALAMGAVMAFGFIPCAILFFCAPAAAALFKREMLIESLVLAVIGAAMVYALIRFGVVAPNMGEALTRWAFATVPAASFVFLMASVFALSGGAAVETAPIEQSVPATLIDSYPGDVFEVSETGDILNASRSAWQRFKGQFPQGDMPNITKLFQAVNREDDDVMAAIVTTFLTHRPASALARTISGSSGVKLSVMPKPKNNADSEIQSVASALVFLTDMSKEADLIEALERENAHAQSEAASKSLFFAGVSHELRTPLNAIIGFSDMMRSRLFGPLPGKYAEYADLIHDSGQHMLDLIGDVLDMSKIDAGEYSLSYDHFDAADVLRSSLKMIRPSADAAEVILDARIDDDMPILMEADRRAVRQILLNLLSNSVKFTPKGGRVTASAREDKGVIILTVEDTGTGMNAEELSGIGAPYRQAKSATSSQARGTGLGLSLVKSLVDLHGGSFDISSEPGQGTQAQVFLPATPLAQS